MGFGRPRKLETEGELYEYAVGALGRRMRSVAELKRLLRQRVEVETEIGQLIGPTGFIALSRLDQGSLMSLHGKPVDTTQYLVGNPLIARRIIGLNRTAALHAPFPLAIYGDDQGVHVAYTQPSSSFGSLGSADIDLIAKELDAMILGTVEQVCRT